MKIKNFKELDCWKRARELVRLIYDFTKKEKFCRDFGLRDQIQRAVVSAMANVAEGFGTNSDKDFVRFLSISLQKNFTELKI